MGLNNYFFDEVVHFGGFVGSKGGAWMRLADLLIDSIEHRTRVTPVDGKDHMEKYLVISVRNKMCPCYICNGGLPEV